MARHLRALVAVLAVLLTPSAASAAWLPIEEVGNVRPSSQTLHMASNDRGDTILLWGNFQRGLKVAISKRGGPFGEARTVPGSGDAGSAGVDVNEDGRAIVWWTEFVPGKGQRIKLVGLKVDGGFGKPRLVTPTGSFLSFDSVIGPGGRFAFIYSTSSREPTYARVAPPSGKLGRRVTLASGSIAPAELWYLGNRPMIAYRQASDDYGTLRERQIGSGGGRVIATIPKNGRVELDTASNGTQVAFWTGSSGNTEREKQPLVAAVRKPHARFGRDSTLETRIPPQEVAVAVARNGAALVAWHEWNESTTEGDPSPTPEYTPGRIAYSFHPPRGTFDPVQAFQPEPENRVVDSLSADVASSGLAVLAVDGGRFEGDQRRLYAATIDDGGSPSVTPMADFDRPVFLAHRIEIDERDRTAFGWIDETKVLARRGDF